MHYLTQLDDSYTFPSHHLALNNPNGLLAFGGDLSLQRLKIAYKNGIFPWFSPGEPILWWTPNPRAVLIPDKIHISHSMKKFMKKTDYIVTINQCFEDVIKACAMRNNQEETWISPEIQTAYIELFAQGLAHSIEVWQNDVLIGGLYGVAQGQLFCGESMFSKKENASKYGLIKFCDHFYKHGGRLIDSQIANPHTISLGIIEIKRKTYLGLLNKLRNKKLTKHCFQKQTLI